MTEIKFPKSYRVYLAFAAAALVLVFLLPHSGKFNYDYRKGSPWMYETLVAQFEFPVLKTSEQMMQEREALGSETIPYFRKSPSVGQEARNAVASAALGACSSARAALMAKVDGIYSKGVIADRRQTGSDLIFVQRAGRAVKCPIMEVYSVDEAKRELMGTLEEECPGTNADSVCIAAGLYDVIIPDLNLDSKTTDMLHYSSADYMSTTDGVVTAGTILVSKGEIVTAEIAQILDSYKVEYERNLGYEGPSALLWLGNVLLALLLGSLLFFAILYTNPMILGEPNRYLYLLMLFLLTSGAALLMDRYAPENIYMVPFSLSALYMLAFFRTRVVLPVYTVNLLPLLIISHNGVELFIMFLAAGVLTIYTFSHFNRGWLQFVNAFFSFVALVFAWALLHLVNGSEMRDYRTLLHLFLGSLFCVAGYPLIYLFERIFRLVSTGRLQELCDTNSNRLLTELSVKAPGTFQHSLQVMNMCDAAASSIGANVALVRAAAMYHDIGKMANPNCFVENTDGRRSYHEKLTPAESARDIIRHVKDGDAIARKNHLPQIIRDFIVTHHGTTRAGYFYGRFLQNGGSPDSPEAAAFVYDGVKPSTKEQVILMLCDSCEAAARSLQDREPEKLTELVNKIIDGKIAEGQLSESNITMKELNTVRSVICQYVLQVNHPRVAYPSQAQEKGREKASGKIRRKRF